MTPDTREMPSVYVCNGSISAVRLQPDIGCKGPDSSPLGVECLFTKRRIFLHRTNTDQESCSSNLAECRAIWPNSTNYTSRSLFAQTLINAQ